MAQYECQCEVCRGAACPPEPEYWDCEICGEANIEEEEKCWKCGAAADPYPEADS